MQSLVSPTPKALSTGLAWSPQLELEVCKFPLPSQEILVCLFLQKSTPIQVRMKLKLFLNKTVNNDRSN